MPGATALLRGIGRRAGSPAAVLAPAAAVAVVVVTVAAVWFRPSPALVALAVVALAGVVAVLVAPVRAVALSWALIVGIGLVRKLVAGGGSATNDPLIALPFAVLLPFLVARLWWRDRYATHLWLCLAYGGVVVGSFVLAALRQTPDPGALRAVVEEGAPAFCALALTHPDLRRGLVLLFSVIRGSSLLAGLYGIVQFVAPPAWDLRWLRRVIASGVYAFGQASPGQFRLFGPLVSPLAFAVVLSVGILCWIFSRHRLAVRVPVVALLTVPLLLTQVRTCVFALVIVLAVAGAVQMRGRAVIPIAVLVVAVTVVPLVLAALDPARADRYSVAGLSNDVSYQQRVELLRAALPTLVGFGSGPGSSNNGSLVTDNGYLVVFLELGLLGGVLFVAVLLTGTLAGFRAAVIARGAPGAAAPLAIVAFYGLVQASASVIQVQVGLPFWAALAVLGASVRPHDIIRDGFRHRERVVDEPPGGPSAVVGRSIRAQSVPR